MNIIDMILKSKGVWIVTFPDQTKWVIDLDNMMFDNYKWYKAVGTIESDLDNEQLDTFLKSGSWKKLK